MTAPSLSRQVFRTSRLAEFCSEKEVVNQTGHDVKNWPLVALKELVDNALDGAEEAGIAPVIEIIVSKDGIIVGDNGPGIAPETVIDIIDYTVRVSSREAYVSATRGAQGNALKTILAMPFALDGERGDTIIESQGVERLTWILNIFARRSWSITCRNTASIGMLSGMIADTSQSRMKGKPLALGR